jgi:TolB-like protein/tRNA A-37 threonylcarbamoyl transferase component Bud32/Tfp pilus assembly protein PilF
MNEEERLKTALATRYRLEQKLGEGGMATVYLAEDLKHHRQVALKVLKPELAAAVGAERFLREIQVTANLHHPHILPLFDSGEADGAVFYVMPFVRGESLRDRLRRERQLPVPETIRILQQVAGALEVAHRQGIIHRDIKPENILLEDGEALLTDFGIALADADAGRLTGTGLSIGTLEYMSPEQATAERDLDARSDVYALGAVAYEMLTGEVPVAGQTARALLTKLVTEIPTPLASLRDGVPPALGAAVMRALAKAPADRFPSARAFAEALTASPGRMAHFPRRLRAAALVVLGLLGVYALARSGLARRLVGGSGPAAPVAIRSIAVLPLDNYSRDSTQEYFAEGMTDELTTALATISQLRVISRGSAMQFQGRNRPATPAIAKALDVDAIVEGSVMRSGDRVRITAQLIDARADRHLWAKSFERNSSDVLALQAELATAIAREINIHLTASEQSRLATAPSVSPEAHDAYLRGRYFFNRPSDENLKKAIAQFEEAVRLSPTFAPAYSGLSDAYLWAGYNEGFLTASQAKPMAKAAAERAVQLDSMSAEAHTSLAVFKLFYEYDWEGCEREFRRAIALNPSYAYAHDQFALALAFTGRFEESEAESRRAEELDPLSPQVLVDAAVAQLLQKNLTAAKELARRAGELDPTFFFPVMIDGWAEVEAGKFGEAIPFLQRAQAMGAPPFVSAFLAYAYGAAGEQQRATAILDSLRKMAPDGRAPPFSVALVYLGLGDHTRAIGNLERALDADSQMLPWLGRDPMFDPLRSEPRFQALLKRLNFSS